MPIPSTFRIPLQVQTRKKGRNLLILSIVSWAVIEANMVPTEIMAFGVSFSETRQSVIILALLIFVVYALYGFIVYGVHDFLENRAVLYDEKIKEHQSRPSKGVPVTKESVAEAISSPVRYYLNKRDQHPAYRPLFVMRFLYDCLLPFLAGCYSVWVLTRAFFIVSRS